MQMPATLVPFVLATIVTGISAQQTGPADVADREAQGRIEALSARLRFGGREGVPPRELDAVLDRVHVELDKYAQGALAVTDSSERTQQRLRTVLASHQPNLEYADLPLARVADLSGGRSLVVAYTIVRGPHNDVATVRGYRSEGNRFQLIATTGEDFEGYSMFKTELTSPIPGEFWLLASGQAQTFNGKKVRFRLYAFDGQSFRTVWSPEDVFNATAPRLTERGFAIDHEIRKPPYSIHDEYSLTVNGPIKID